MKIMYVPADVVPRLTNAYKFLKNGEKRFLPRADALDFYVMCIHGQALLWGVFSDDVTEDTLNESLVAACVTTITPYPRCKFLTVMAIAGSRMNEWLPDLFETLRDFQRKADCIGIEEWGRDGWLRTLLKFGFQKSYTLMEYLDDGEGQASLATDRDDVDSHTD